MTHRETVIVRRQGLTSVCSRRNRLWCIHAQNEVPAAALLGYVRHTHNGVALAICTEGRRMPATSLS